MRVVTKPTLPRVFPSHLPKGSIDRDAANVIRRLREAHHQAFLVGGGVRDLLLGRAPKDFDIATSASPNEVRHIFRNSRIIGRRFRLVHVMFSGGKIIEVATFRRDPGGARGPVPSGNAGNSRLIRDDNEFGEPDEDARRRDFTLNGLFFDPETNEVIDYVNGMPDLERRVLRMIGEPSIRIEEDPVRILRAIKFSARLDLGIEPTLYDAIVAKRHTLKLAAKARVLEELLRLLRSGASERSYYLAWSMGVLSSLLPEFAAFLDDADRIEGYTWKRMIAVDMAIREGQAIPDSSLLANLLLGMAEEAMSIMPWATEDDVDAAIGDVFLRLTAPRRMRDRVRLILLAQKKMETGSITKLRRMDFFSEAAWLFGLQCKAKGQRAPEWTDVVPEPEKDDGFRKRRRRPRKGRRPDKTS